jgi:hypothetical protein
VRDFYFDDETWTLRYLVVETGGWFTGRQVLISPLSVARTDWDGRHVVVSLTRAQVRNAPDIDTAMPVSRRQEIAYYRYYGWPVYWSGSGLWGPWMTPMIGVAGSATTTPQPTQPLPAPPESGDEEVHLRAVNEVLGYDVEARDGAVGRVQDFLVQDFNWTIQEILVDTSQWRRKGDVLIRPAHIVGMNWTDREVAVDLDRAAIENGPAYRPGEPPVEGPWNNETGGAR